MPNSAGPKVRAAKMKIANCAAWETSRSATVITVSPATLRALWPFRGTSDPFCPRRLICPIPCHHNCHGTKQDAQIACHRACFSIVHVQRHTLVIGRVVAPADLP